MIRMPLSDLDVYMETAGWVVPKEFSDKVKADRLLLLGVAPGLDRVRV